jgi:hypothetical protein
LKFEGAHTLRLEDYSGYFFNYNHFRPNSFTYNPDKTDPVAHHWIFRKLERQVLNCNALIKLMRVHNKYPCLWLAAVFTGPTLLNIDYFKLEWKRRNAGPVVFFIYHFNLFWTVTIPLTVFPMIRWFRMSAR